MAGNRENLLLRPLLYLGLEQSNPDCRIAFLSLQGQPRPEHYFCMKYSPPQRRLRIRPHQLVTYTVETMSNSLYSHKAEAANGASQRALLHLM